jgi:hypothetical protein
MISALAALNAEGWMLGENPEKVSMAIPDIAHRSLCLQACHISVLVRYRIAPMINDTGGVKSLRQDS